MGVDVVPTGRSLLELLAKLADEDVDRAVAVGHRISPHPLVDRLALEDLAFGLGQQLQQLELTPRQVEARARDEGLETVGADLELTGDHRPGLELGTSATATAKNRLDPRHDLFGVAWLP